MDSYFTVYHRMNTSESHENHIIIDNTIVTLDAVSKYQCSILKILRQYPLRALAKSLTKAPLAKVHFLNDMNKSESPQGTSNSPTIVGNDYFSVSDAVIVISPSIRRIAGLRPLSDIGTSWFSK